MTLFHALLNYLLLSNLIAFVTMGADKLRARRHLRRISESTLLLLAVIGGSAGSILGMLLFRHKAKHAVFSIGLPLIFLLQCAFFAALFRLSALN